MAVPSPAERARRLFEASTNMTVATADAEGRPWVSPVFFAPDAAYDLYWTSEPGARHSENIRATGQAAIVIVEPDPDRPVDAVYLFCDATELTDPAEIEAAIPVLSAKPQPEKWRITSAADVSDGGPWRIYCAHPRTVEVRTSATAGDKAVARRRDAEFRPVDPGAEG